MAISVTDIERALLLLGGVASVEDIHQKVLEVTPFPPPLSSRQIVRARLQENCAASGAYRGRSLFRNVHGLSNRKGIWALVDSVGPTPPRTPALSHAEKDRKERNPPWSRDELILALDLYFTNPANPPGKGSSAVAELSAILNKLHRLNGVSGAPTLRNENGVYLKMMNLRSLDPAYTAQGKVGMQSGGALEKVVWADYEGRRADLKADAEVIRQAVTDANETALAKLPVAEPHEGEEGGVIMRLHKRYERDPKLVAEKRKAAAATGELACEVCGFDFKATYGDLGEGYIEVHHTKPVHTLLAGTKTKLNDLVLLCANCHRMAHRKRIPLTIIDLKMASRNSIDAC